MYLRATIVLWTHAKKYLQYRFTNCFLKIWKNRRHFHRPFLLIYFMNIDGVFHEWRHEICGIPFFKTFLMALSCFSWLFGNFPFFAKSIMLITCTALVVDYLYCPCGWLVPTGLVHTAPQPSVSLVGLTTTTDLILSGAEISTRERDNSAKFSSAATRHDNSNNNNNGGIISTQDGGNLTNPK